MRSSAPRMLLSGIVLYAALAAHAAPSWKLDFGTSDTAKGYTAVTEKSLYTPDKGYGWVKGEIHADAQDKPNSLLRDFLWSPYDAEFRIDLTPGIYKLSLTSGDNYAGNHSTQISVNAPGTKFQMLAPPAGEFVTVSAAFEVPEDHLSIHLSTSSKNWLVNALTLSPAETTSAVRLQRTHQAASTPRPKFQSVGLPLLSTETVAMRRSIEDLWTNFNSALASAPEIAPTGLTRQDYLKLIQGNVDFFKSYQNEQGAIIDPVAKKEWQYSTPAFALAAATLVKYSNRQDLTEPAMKAMDWASLTLGQHKAADDHSDFFSIMLAHAYRLLEPHAGAERVTAWRKNLSFDPYQIYRYRPGIHNWNVVALAGDAELYYLGLRKDLSYTEDCLARQINYFTPFGMYLDFGTPAMAYDHFSRAWLADMLAMGYAGDYATRLGEVLKAGALTSVFMQSPEGELPTGGRSAQHQWNEAEQCLSYEIQALYAMARTDSEMAGMYKRAAHLALQSMLRWQRPSGELYVVKNRVEPEQRHGYETYSAHSQYNLMPMALLAMAYDHAERTEKFAERPTPSDVGGFVLDLREHFHKVFANAGGMYLELDTAGDLHYNPTGLLRIHKRGMNTLIGPSDGLVGSGDTKTTAAVGVAWKDKKGNWRRLAEMTPPEIFATFVHPRKQTPDHVVFDVTYMLMPDGRFTITEHYDVTPDKVEQTTSFTGYDGPVQLSWPVFASDGKSSTTVTSQGRSVRVEMNGSAQNFTALNAASVTVGDTAYVSRNGWARLATAEYPSAGAAPITLRIEPGKAWQAVLSAPSESTTQSLQAQADPFKKENILATMKKAFQFIVAHPRPISDTDWERGALYTGIMGAYYGTKDPEYLEQALRWGERNKWQLNADFRGFRNADNQTCAQTYLELYMLKGGEEKIAHIKQVMDDMVSSPPKGRIEWWWCDALYMAPPVMVRMSKATNDPKYATLMNSMWWDTTDYLYDPAAHLYYRDDSFFKDRTENGQKVFWSRGNGWVMGGIVRVLEYLPENDPRRADFIKLFRTMTDTLVALQGPDGLWRTSLLDYWEYPMPETSGTGFYTYAIAWGINHGLLERDKYLPVVRKGWEGLMRSVYADGKLGWVQHVAGSPGQVAPDMTREYAVGAFLLAGTEMLRLQGDVK